MRSNSKEKAKFGRPGINAIGGTVSGVISCALVSAISIFLSPSSAKAFGIIDTFDSCTSTGPVDLLPDAIGGSTSCTFGWGPPGSTNISGSYNNNTTTATAVDIISSNRVIDLITTGIGGSPARGSYNINDGNTKFLTVSNNAGAASNFTITYSGISANLTTLGGGPPNSRFGFNLLGGTESTNKLTLNITQAGGTSTGSYTISNTDVFDIINNGSTTVYIPFGSFTGFFTANQSSPVTQISLTIDSPNSKDIALDGIGVEPVPFEYSHELGLVGLAGLFGAYKLRSKKSSKVESEKTDV